MSSDTNEYSRLPAKPGLSELTKEEPKRKTPKERVKDAMAALKASQRKKSRKALGTFTETGFVGMSRTLAKRLRGWKLKLVQKKNGKAYFADAHHLGRKATRPTIRKAKIRRLNKLARKARRVRRIRAA